MIKPCLVLRAAYAMIFACLSPALAQVGTTYCSPAVTNASGLPGSIFAFGSADLSVNGNRLTLVAANLPTNEFGIFVTSRSTGLVQNPGGSLGTLCLGLPTGRYAGPGQILGTGAIGRLQLEIDLAATPEGGAFTQIQGGDTWHFQAWFRDRAPGGITTSNFSDAVEVQFTGSLFPDILIPEGGEDFDDDKYRDDDGTGAIWELGLLKPGISGGSGRLGELRVPAGVTVTLDTDEQIFPLANAPIDVLGNGTGAEYPRALTVTDGVFEFSKLIVEEQGRLVIKGGHPARLLVRGSAVIASGSIVDASGTSAPAHDSLIVAPQMGDVVAAAGGPGGGAGGLGADRSDLGSAVPDFRNLFLEDAVQNPGANRDGLAGEGVGGGAIGGGNGGDRFPAALPTGITIQSDAIQDTLGDTGFNVFGDPLLPTDGDRCMLQMIAGPGGGGAYALDGEDGTILPIDLPVTQNPAGRPVVSQPTPGGSSAGLGLAPPSVSNNGYTRRLLRWQDGNLQGGSGGGGGGNHPYGSRATSQNGSQPVTTPDQCLTDFGSFLFSNYDRWLDHSGAQGGGGGGALELTMGNILLLEGALDVSGGDGGSALSAPPNTAGSFAVPGGGGSGGAVRVRARRLNFGSSGVVNVRGGLGGAAPWTITSNGMRARGGNGSPGLARFEDADTTGQVSFATLASRLIPFDLGDPASSVNFLSYAPAAYEAGRGSQRPDTLSGATSCWMRPVGAFTSLGFVADAGTGVADQGWTLDVVVDDGAGGTILRPYRGTDASTPTSWEEQYGNLIGYDLLPGEAASPIVVRFQGARTLLQDLDDPLAGVDPCDIDILDPFSGVVVPGSVTPWVAHPADLDQVRNAAGQPYEINMIRYCVIFDDTNDGEDQPGLVLDTEGVRGVTNLQIRAVPR